jgi:hypothetical protein
MIAAVGIGMFGNYRTACDHSVSGDKLTLDNEAAKIYYNKKYVKYNELARAIKGVVKTW